MIDLANQNLSPDKKVVDLSNSRSAYKFLSLSNLTSTAVLTYPLKVTDEWLMIRPTTSRQIGEVSACYSPTLLAITAPYHLYTNTSLSVNSLEASTCLRSSSALAPMGNATSSSAMSVWGHCLSAFPPSRLPSLPRACSRSCSRSISVHTSLSAFPPLPPSPPPPPPSPPPPPPPSLPPSLPHSFTLPLSTCFSLISTAIILPRHEWHCLHDVSRVVLLKLNCTLFWYEHLYEQRPWWLIDEMLR